ncbi:MAG: hypothetical protein ACOCT9_02575 [archaeon]
MNDLKPNFENIIHLIQQEKQGKFGIICLNCILIKSLMEDVQAFIEKYKIPIPEGEILTNLDYLKYICVHFYKQFQEKKAEMANNKSFLEYIGEIFINEEIFSKYLALLDFYAHQDLLEAFADYCANIGFTVYNARKVEDYSLNLYLSKRTPFLRTEAAIVKTGNEMNIAQYEEALENLNAASKIAYWKVFVTTPVGVLKIGLERIIEDMRQSHIWLYVIDPIRMRVFGVVKGDKQNRDKDLRDKFINKLPRKPLRVPSKIMDISNYKFNESDSYDPDDFVLYDILSQIEHNKLMISVDEVHQYEESFQNLIIIEKNSGIPMISYSSEKEQNNRDLVSGFLTAMDSFVSRMGGPSTLREINYKGFFIQAAYGENIKILLFLSKQANRSLKERLQFLVNYLEKNYQDEIQQFKKSGDTGLFDDGKIIDMIRQILDI